MSPKPPVARGNRLHQYAPLDRQPVVDTNHKVPFVASVSNSYPYAFNLLVAILQAQLFTLCPFLDIVGNTSTTLSLPVTSE